jgi:tetratricopeptide (TPR) repeat protein
MLVKHKIAMKFCVFLMCFLGTSQLWSQTQRDKKFSGEVCICLNGFKSVTVDDYMQCLEKSMIKHESLILQEVKRLHLDTTDEVGYNLGKALYNRIFVSMVGNCEAYFNLMEALRMSTFTASNIDSIKLILVSLNNNIAIDNVDFLIERGVIYTLSEDYALALKDLDRAIELDSSKFQSFYYKAYILEKKGQFVEAQQLYDYLYNVTHENLFLICSAMMQHKQKK